VISATTRGGASRLDLVHDAEERLAMDAARQRRVEVAEDVRDEQCDRRRDGDRGTPAADRVDDELRGVQRDRERDRRQVPEDARHRVVLVEREARREELDEPEDDPPEAEQQPIRAVEAPAHEPPEEQQHQHVRDDAEERRPELRPDEDHRG
jgi:hypothetical protein